MDIGVNGSGNGDWGWFIPDEGEVILDTGIRRVDGQILEILCHLRFALVVVDRGEDGRGDVM